VEIFRRLWFLLNRRRFERAIAGEMEFHREMMEREGRTGFGNALRLREQARDAWGWVWLDHLLQDVRYAIRLLRSSPGFAIAAIAVLALGIGGNTAMFSLIHTALLKPLPFEDPERLVFARCTFSGRINPMVSAPDYYDYREQANCFDGFSAVLAGAPKTTVTGAGEPERAAFTYVAGDLFRTLGVAPAAGRWFTPGEGQPGGPPVVMLSGRFAGRRFSTPSAAVGTSLALDGRSYTVVGVMPVTFRFLHDVDVWLPMRRGEAAASVGRQFHNWLIAARLKPGVSLQSARLQVDVISKRLEQEYPASNINKALRLDPLQAALSERQKPRLLVLMAAVALVLLITCANVAGLLLARGSARRPELAMRAALGASRGRIASQLLVESLTLALFSGVLGVALAYWLSRLLPLAAGLSDNAPRGLDATVLLFALAVSLMAGVLSGIAPALRSSSHLLARDLAPGARTTTTKAGTSLRSTLVVAQVAVSLVLLVGAGLLIRSLARLAASDLGFDAERLLTGEIQLLPARYPQRNQRVRFFDGLREDLAAVPGVKAAGFISNLPLRNPGFDLPTWNTNDPPAKPADVRTSLRRLVLPGYFNAVGIPLLAGRDFSRDDRENSPLTMVISEQMARTLFPDRNPLGQRVSVDMFSPQPLVFEVIGVVGDARMNFVGDEARMAMYLSYYQFPEDTLRFAVRTDRRPEAISQSVRNLVRAHDRDIPVENLVSMESVISESLAPQRATTALLALFACVALLLASIGLYGVLAYSVSRRTHEIGVRVALGAQPRDVLRLVIRQGVVLTVIGVAAGVAGALGLTRFLADLLFGVLPTDLTTFLAVPPGLIAVALLATYIPARRAANVDPAVALRHE
jgi:predicted permease